MRWAIHEYARLISGRAVLSGVLVPDLCLAQFLSQSPLRQGGFGPCNARFPAFSCSVIPSGAPGKPDKMVSTLSSLILGLSHRIARELTFSWRGLRNNIAFSERIIGLSRVLLLARVPYTSYSRAVSGFSRF